MGEVLGELLPVALGVAISPVPMIAVILMLLAPHAKTHMAPSLLARQRAAGAWGFTAATPRQVRQLDEWGVTRIIHANTVVDAGFIECVGERLARGVLEYFCYVDSVEGSETGEVLVDVDREVAAVIVAINNDVLWCLQAFERVAAVVARRASVAAHLAPAAVWVRAPACSWFPPSVFRGPFLSPGRSVLT